MTNTTISPWLIQLFLLLLIQLFLLDQYNYFSLTNTTISPWLIQLFWPGSENDGGKQLEGDPAAADRRQDNPLRW